MLDLSGSRKRSWSATFLHDTASQPSASPRPNGPPAAITAPQELKQCQGGCRETSPSAHDALAVTALQASRVQPFNGHSSCSGATSTIRPGRQLATVLQVAFAKKIALFLCLATEKDRSIFSRMMALNRRPSQPTRPAQARLNPSKQRSVMAW